MRHEKTALGRFSFGLFWPYRLFTNRQKLFKYEQNYTTTGSGSSLMPKRS